MTAPHPLDALQRWLLAAITHPAGIEAGLASPEAQTEYDIAPDRLAAIVLPSRQQSASERLAVYSQAYFARLLEVMRELFPCLRSAVGDELFDRFAIEYLQAHPPRSYTLHHLASCFPQFLDQTRPADDAWAAFAVELARLEQAIDQVFDGPGPEELGSGMSAVGNALRGIPGAASDPSLTLVPGFRLLAFSFPVSSYYTGWKADQQPGWPEPAEQFVALLRRDYIVRRYELSRPQYELLNKIAAGLPLEESFAAIASDDCDLNDLAAQVRTWFTFWGREQFFATEAHYASIAPGGTDAHA